MLEIYACRNTDEMIRKISSSGGIYYLLAESVLRQGGLVYAACYNDDLDVEHRCIDNIEDLKKSCGSKYVQSDIRGIFQDIRDRLEEDIRILFVGTPCQTAGLLNYIGNRPENLVCVDFVCHGVPGQKEWNRYKESLKRRGFQIADVNMRDKSRGWKNSSYCWKLTDYRGNIRYEKRIDNVYMQGLIHNVYLAKGCYNCQFKGFDRPADFTLGDFWGIEYLYPEMDDNLGTSLLMIHTEKGCDIFDHLKSKLVYWKITKEDAVSYNKSIINGVGIPAERDIYFGKMEKGEDFIRVISLFNRKWKAIEILRTKKRNLKKWMRKGT